jgi:hypothetical protein
MAAFRVLLIGSNQPLLVDLPASGVSDLIALASHSKFIEGVMVEPDDDGVCCGVMFQSCRIQLAIEL